jgi:hypothetical protein
VGFDGRKARLLKFTPTRAGRGSMLLSHRSCWTRSGRGCRQQRAGGQVCAAMTPAGEGSACSHGRGAVACLRARARGDMYSRR